jgi:hypothetical protein
MPGAAFEATPRWKPLLELARLNTVRAQYSIFRSIVAGLTLRPDPPARGIELAEKHKCDGAHAFVVRG